MDHAELAKKIRLRIFEQASEDGRVLHGDSMDRVIAEVLRSEMPTPDPKPAHGYGAYGYPTCLEVAGQTATCLEIADLQRARAMMERQIEELLVSPIWVLEDGACRPLSELRATRRANATSWADGETSGELR